MVGRRSRGEKYTCFVRLLNVARALRQRKQACQRAGARAYIMRVRKRNEERMAGGGDRIERKKDAGKSKERNENLLRLSGFHYHRCPKTVSLCLDFCQCNKTRV